LFVNLGRTGDAHFGEVAHMIAAADNGPRGDALTDEALRGSWENLILLCANCHTLIDRADEDFPIEEVREWKTLRLEQVAAGVGLLEFKTREEARAAIDPYLLQNRVVHTLRGPESELHADPLGEGARVWREDVASVIIPNHRTVLSVIDRNRELLRDSEKQLVETYRTHVKDLIDRHTRGDEDKLSIRYPEEMDNLFA
jgi:hypothetical protein